MFPMGYKQSWSEWWARKPIAETEKTLFSTAGIHTTGAEANAKDIDTPIGGGLHLNEIEIEGPKIGTAANKHIVLVHGYGAAKGFFYRNVQALAMPGYTIHAVDWLGYGRSSRPKFRIKPKTPMEGVTMAESFFVDSLEKWRQERNIGEFSLIAHSLGAYCGAAYTLKHPDRVDKLMLVSPAAVLRNEMSLPMETVGTVPDPEIPIVEMKFNAPGWFKWGWERNVSPFSLVRNSGPLGPKFVSAWTSRRFGGLPENERSALHDYSYSIFNGKGSGEYALSYLLAIGASARWPLAERVSPIKVPTMWVYGDRDWMDIRGGQEAARVIKNSGGPKARVVEIPNAGHHLYHDNVQRFNELAREFIKSPVPLMSTPRLNEVSL